MHWNLSTILKTSNKSVGSNVFWYVKVYIFWNIIQYTMYWDNTQMCNFRQNKRYKGCTRFYCVSSNWSVLLLICDPYMSWCTKFVWHFSFSIPSRFYWSLYFCSTKSMASLILIPFKIRIIKKPHTVFSRNSNF